MHLICPNCQSESDVLLIDCSLPLGSVERDTIRYCVACRPQAAHPLAHLLPQWIAKWDIPEDEKQAAFQARRPARAGTARLLPRAGQWTFRRRGRPRAADSGLRTHGISAAP